MIEKIKNHVGSYMFVFVLMVVLIIGFFMIDTIQHEQFKSAKDKTLKEINDMNESSDYRRGWNDAIERIDAWYHAPVNATMTAAGLFND